MEERYEPEAWAEESASEPPDAAASPPAEGEAGAPHQGNGFSRLLRGLVSEGLGTLLPAVLIALLIHLFLAQATRVYGQSMEPTLHTNDRVIVEKITYRFRSPERGDVVVVRVKDRSQPLIKRIVGLPGETIAIHDGRVYIDGRPLDEPYLSRPTHGFLPPTRIPPLHYFVLGDNRDASSDSRSFGPVAKEDIVGRAIFRYWPPTQIGLVR